MNINELSKKSGIAYKNCWDGITELLEKGIIVELEKKRKTKKQVKRKKQRIFGLHPVNGIMKIIYDPVEKINHEHIWNRYFECFSKEYNQKISDKKLDLKNSTDKIQASYENQILKIKKETLLPDYFKRNLEKFKNLETPDKIFNDYPNLIHLIETIGLRNPLSIEEIFKLKLFKKITAKEIYREPKKIVQPHSSMYAERHYEDIYELQRPEEKILELKRMGILRTTKNKYDLSYSGLLLLFYNIYKKANPKFHIEKDDLGKPIWIELHENEKIRLKDYSKKIDYIIDKYSDLLPHIFPRPYRKKLQIDNFSILYIFYSKFFRENNFKESSNSVAFQWYFTLTKIEQIREIFQVIRFQDYFATGISVLQKLVDEKREKSNVFNSPRRQAPEIIIKYLYDLVEKKTKKTWTKKTYKKFDDIFSRSEFSDREQKIVDDWHIPLLMLVGDFGILTVSTLKRPALDPNLAISLEGFTQRVRQKITWDFYLGYQTLFPEKWNKNFGKDNEIRKWLKKQIEELTKFSLDYISSIYKQAMN